MALPRDYLHVELPLRVAVGPAALDDLARELDRAGVRRAFVVCGRSFAAPNGGHRLLATALGGRLVHVHPGARPHSPAAMVQETARLMADTSADGVIAVGGGSAIVTARAATVLLAEGGALPDLATRIDSTGQMISPRLKAPKLPQFVVATTPTTATVKAGSAVLDETTQRRMALFDPQTRARMVCVVPALLDAAPHDIFLSAGLNTLCMAIEGLIARKGDPFADTGLIHAARLAADALPQLGSGQDAAARADLVAAAILCGRATDSTNGGMASALGHAIGARHGVENGLINALAMPAVLIDAAEAARPDLPKVAIALGLPRTASAADIATHLRALVADLGVKPRLRDLGVSQDALPELADLAFADWFLRGNPRPVESAAQVLGFLRHLW